MSYEVIEAAVEGRIEALSNFGTDQVTIGDWRVLSGGHPWCVMLEYGGVEIEYESQGGGTTFNWVVRVHLYGRYTDDATVRNNMRDRRQEILDQLLKFPQLNGTAGVIDSIPRRGQWDDEQEVTIGGVKFLHETIEVEVEEQVAITLSE